jgi:tetratricopeptide (TPR) repeat protein
MPLDSVELVRRAGEIAEERPDEAIEIANRVLIDEPDNPGALFVVASVLLQAARHVQAIQIAKRIAEVCPKDPRGWQLLALSWGEIHRYDESIRCAEKALACKRTDKTLADVAYAHTNAGNWDAADKYGREALLEAGRNPSKLAADAIRDASVSQAYVRLAKGDWRAGFEGYRLTMRTKWRKERVYCTADGTDTKEWQGEPDAVVIATGEQGLGDEIMAASVLPDVVKRCRKFILDCDHRLAALFARSFPEVIVSPSRREEAVRTPIAPTHHKTLFGLSEILRQSDEDFHRKPFLIPNQEYVGMFRELFGGQKVIGLAWSGGLPRTGMEQRFAGLNAFLPLIRRGGAEFVSLEYKDDREEVRQFAATHGMRVRRLPWVAQGPDMDLLAGLIAACDEVVGVGTASLHMAGALGVPTTFIVNRGLGWAFARPEMMWYPPTTKIWRKNSGESWRDCINRLVESRK